MRISHLNALRALEATLRTGSYTAASRELGVTPAAVGQQVRTLEDFLGIALFHRTGRGATPTENARRAESRLTVCFSGIADVLTQLRAAHSERRVAVTLPSSLAENWLIHQISDFYIDHSSVDLRLDATNRMVDLLSEDFDFALRYSPPAGDDYAEIELFGDFVLPVCSAEFASRFGLTPDLRSLENVPLVHLGKRTPDPQWADWETWGKAFGFAVEPMKKGVQYTRFSSGLQVAVAGQGLVLCGVIESFDAVRQGRLVMPFGPALLCPTGYRYRLVWLRDRQLSGLQSSFKTWLQETASDFTRAVDDLFGISLN